MVPPLRVTLPRPVILSVAPLSMPPELTKTEIASPPPEVTAVLLSQLFQEPPLVKIPPLLMVTVLDEVIAPIAVLPTPPGS